MSGIHNFPVLSICIPTYNNGEYVYDLVSRILNYRINDLEVVVMDNNSTDNTEELLTTITDSRLMYIRNTENIGGMLNSVKVLSNASGEFALLCLDRDDIDHRLIASFIECLRSKDDLVFGRCNYSSIQNRHHEIFEPGFFSLLNMAYSSSHPSGYFYKVSVYNNLDFITTINTDLIECGFYHDLINAEISFLGKSMIVDIPIISVGYIESKEKLEVNKSHTWNSSSYYGLPGRRLLEYNIYLTDIAKRNLSIHERKIISGAVFFRGLIRSTWSYRDAFMDLKNCSHYHLIPRRVTIFELLKIDYIYSKSFLNQKIKINAMSKIKIIFDCQIKLCYHLIKYILLQVKRNLNNALRYNIVFNKS
jgi:glycosyltransferase involved in cell wall biosynthesis